MVYTLATKRPAARERPPPRPVCPSPPTAKEGVVTAYGYDLKDLGAYFFTNFKAGKVWRVEVSLK